MIKRIVRNGSIAVVRKVVRGSSYGMKSDAVFSSFKGNNGSITHIAVSNFSYLLKNKQIFEQLKDLDKHDLNEMLVDMINLNKQQKQYALKMLLNKIYNKKLKKQWISNSKMVIHLKRYPELYVESLLYLAKQNFQLINEKSQTRQDPSVISEVEKKIINETNDLFIVAFQWAKKCSKQKLTKTEAILHKRFAQYHFFFISEFGGESQRFYAYEKSDQYFKSSTMKGTEHVIQLYNELQNYDQKGKELLLTPDQISIGKNYIKEGMRTMLQSTCETLFHHFLMKNDSSVHFNFSDWQKVFGNKSLAGLQGDFSRVLKSFQLIENVKKYSLFYFKLKKLSIGIDFYSKAAVIHHLDKSQQQIKQFKQQSLQHLKLQHKRLDKMAEQALIELQGNDKYATNVIELSQLLFSIRTFDLSYENKTIKEKKESIVSEVQKIMELFSTTQKKKVVQKILANMAVKSLNSGSQKLIGGGRNIARHKKLI